MQDRNKRLDGRIVLVTGAAGGIGAQIARQAAGEGARVIISDVRRDDGQKLAEELGTPARFVAHDVGDEDAWGIADIADDDRSPTTSTKRPKTIWRTPWTPSGAKTTIP